MSRARLSRRRRRGRGRRFGVGASARPEVVDLVLGEAGLASRVGAGRWSGA